MCHHPVVPLRLRPRRWDDRRRSVRREGTAECHESGGRAGVGACHPGDRAVPLSQDSRRRPVMKPLSRRTIIRGAGGVAIGLPFLAAMQPRVASAQSAAPKRLILWFTANGQMPAYWYPTGTETNFTLNTSHVPLQPYKNKLILFDGIDNDASKVPAYGGHQGSMAAMVSGMPHTNAGFDAMRPTGPSIDQLVADKIGGATKIKSLQTGVNPGGDGGNPFTR